MSYRLAGALIALRDEIDAWRPDRDRASDGWIGDVDHAGRGDDSDHNPWIVDRNGTGVVRAIDVDEDGIDAPGLVEHLRRLGAAGDPRLENWGYLIYEGRIAGGNPLRGPARWNWRPYTGKNLHRHHFHISTSRSPAGYDAPGPWGVLHPIPTPEEPNMPLTEADLEKIRNVVREEQRTLVGWLMALAEALGPRAGAGLRRITDRARHHAKNLGGG